MSHTYINLMVHAVFSTKGRQRWFADPEMRHQLHCYMGGILKNNGVQPLGINGYDDHVHLFFSIHQDHSVSALIKETKRVSSIWIKSRDPKFIQFSWQRGYSAFSVSQSMKQKVQNYIARQEHHHGRISYAEELDHILAKNELNRIP